MAVVLKTIALLSLAGSSPASPANFSGCSADDYTGWTWNPVFAGSNPAAQTNVFQFVFCADVAQRQEALVLETR